MTTVASARGLSEYGLSSFEHTGIDGGLTFERPAFLHGPRRIKHCSLGAFTLINGGGSTSMYRCRLGRYAQIGEAVILGPPEHPQDWFSNHPFAFTREQYLPSMYRMPEFERLAPDGSESIDYVQSVPSDTWIGHEAYVGAGAYIKRGVTIGDGAVVGARSVVTRDVPPYAIAVGSPARVTSLRFAESLVARFLALQWWHYDLAPYKHAVDFACVEETLAFFEQRKRDGELQPLQPAAYHVAATDQGWQVTSGSGSLYAPAQPGTAAHTRAAGI